MREECSEQDERCHAERDDAFGVVDLVDDEVAAGFDPAAEVVVHQADEYADWSKQPDDPDVGFADFGGVLQ